MYYRRITTYLQQSQPYSQRPWIVVLASSCIIFFLLALFQPFGMSNITYGKWSLILGFSLVTGLCTAINGYIFPLIFKKFYNPQKWTIGKSLLNDLSIILLIGFGNFIFDCIVIQRSPETRLSVLVAYLLITFFIGLIPTAIITFFIQNYELKNNLRKAQEINKHLNNRIKVTEPEESPHFNEVILKGNTKEELNVTPKNILFIESSGNYIKVHHLINNEIKQNLLRITISHLEKDLLPFHEIVRCHRAFLVNTAYITGVSGNSQGLQLSLKHTPQNVPVSRSYINAIKEKLKD